MHFTDLQTCTYGRHALSPDAWKVPLLAIGWLEEGHPFTTGTVDEALIRRVRQFHEETQKQFFQHSYLGLHACSLCKSGRASNGIKGSQINLIIPGTGCVYMASGGIAHYLEKHAYQPPEKFISALMSCPLPSAPEYHQALISTNGGERPQFLWTFEEMFPDLARLKREGRPL